MLKSPDEDPSPVSRLRLPVEDPLPVKKLARAIGSHVATIYRWGSPRGVGGHRLILTKIGGRTYVEHSAWHAFHRALNSHMPATTEIRQSRTSSNEIEAELDAEGL